MPILTRLFGGNANGDEPRVRLFLETMLIMIAADGHVSEDEMRRFMTQVRARPELSEVPRATLDRHLQEAFLAIQREGLERRVEAISRGLRRRDQRLAALSMAVTTASGDGTLSAQERAVVELLQRYFQLSDEQVSAATHAAQRGEVDVFVDGMVPVEQYYIEAMLLMVAADGTIDPAELDRFSKELAHQPAFDHISPDNAGAFLERSLNHLERDGLEARLEILARELEDQDVREVAFRMALEMCLADGSADPQERTLLKLFQSHFDLTDEFVAREIKHILGGRGA